MNRFFIVMGLDDLWRVRDGFGINGWGGLNDSRGMSEDDAREECHWLNERHADGRL